MFRLFVILLLMLAPLTVGAETLSAPSPAQGGRSADALRMAFEGQASRNSASVLQSGKGNEAVLSQSGTDNQGILVQRGRGHSATLTQMGDDNAYAMIQLGRGATAKLGQKGGQAGATVQVGGLPGKI